MGGQDHASVQLDLSKRVDATEPGDLEMGAASTNPSWTSESFPAKDMSSRAPKPLSRRDMILAAQ
jgi:hypothetical protein